MHIPAGVYIMYVLASMYVVQHDVSVCVYSRTRTCLVCICILHMYERSTYISCIIYLFYTSYYLFYELNKIYAYH